MKHIKIGGSDLEKVARLASKALDTARSQQTSNAGSVFVPDGQTLEDGTPKGTGTITGAAGLARWVNDDTIPGTPTGLACTSVDTLVYVTWDGTLDGGVPDDFSHIDVLVDGVSAGQLSRAGCVTVRGLTPGDTVTVTAVAYDDAHDRDGASTPNASPASEPLTVTVAHASALQSDLDALQKDFDAARSSIKDLNDVTLPGLKDTQTQLEADLEQAQKTLDTLNDTTLPAMQDELDTLNDVTLPGVQSAQSQLETDMTQARKTLDTLTGTTLPAVKSDVAQAQEDIKGLTGSVTTAQQTADTATSDLTAYIKATASQMDDMQSQIDGSIQTWFAPQPPDTGNEPASQWTTDALKANHLGDLYYDTITGYCYRWQVSSQQYSWQRITDTDVTKALADAAKAQDTADGKRRVFTSTPTPPYDAGDLWAQGSSGDILVCSTAKTGAQSYAASDWTAAGKYTDDTAARAAQSTADGKNTITRSTNAPTTGSAGRKGDLWFVYNSSSQCTALYVHSGSAWVAQPLANGAIANIDAGKITTGYLSASRIAAGSLSGGKLAANSVTASQIAAGAVGADELAANAVTAGKIAAGAVSASNIVSGTITATQLASGSVGTSQLAANSVSADKIAAGAVSSDKIAANAVTAGKIAANAVSAGKIAANSIGAAQLISGSVSSDKLAVNSVTAAKIATGAVSADKLAANSVTSGKIAAGSVGASQIISGSIVADKIAAQAITSDKLAANAVTAGKLAANAIDGKTITGATIKTTNGRIAINDTGITSTDSNGNTVVSIPSDGTGITATGSITSTTGQSTVTIGTFADFPENVPEQAQMHASVECQYYDTSVISFSTYGTTGGHGQPNYYAKIGNIIYYGTYNLQRASTIRAYYSGTEYSVYLHGEYNGNVPAGNGVHIQFSPHFYDKPGITITEDYDGIADVTARLFEPIVHGVDHAGFWVRLLRRDTHEWATDTQKMHFHWIATAIG